MHTGYIILVFISTLLFFPPTLSAEPETVEIIHYNHLKKITGFTFPKEEMTVSSEVNGRCISIFANVGKLIPEDGVIAEIDRTFVELDLEANRIAKEQVQRQLAEEEKSLRRYSKLLSEKSTPQARLDEVALAADLHKLELKSLLNVAQRLSEQLQRHTITAPPGWKVIERYVTPGEYLQTGSSVAKLGDFRSLLISFGFSSEELEQIQSIPELTIHFPETDRTVPASIFRISPVLDPNTRKIVVDLLLENSQIGTDKELRGGMRAEFSFADKTQKGVFMIPSSAVISKYEASWLVRPDGEKIRVIKLGVANTAGSTLITGKQLSSGQSYLLHPKRITAPGLE